MTITKEDLSKALGAEVSGFRQALTAESDRGCALFATAYLDKALSDLLFVSVVYHKPKIMENDLFDYSAPLGSFSARITMAYYMGRISKVAKRDLDILRKIRNEFAHHPTTVSFDSESTAHKCRELKFSYHEKGEAPRSHFVAAAIGLLAAIHAETYAANAPAAKADDSPTEEQKQKHRERMEVIMNAIGDNG